MTEAKASVTSCFYKPGKAKVERRKKEGKKKKRKKERPRTEGDTSDMPSGRRKLGEYKT
ncbi:MAG: hypothetical protein K6A32_06540 [Bacteroidales bacterium]|nr:hypothetical protein [Bacteroidales bacterium]